MELVIRMVRTDDLDAITAIEAACFPAAEAAERITFQARIATFPESFLVAEINSKIIGFINGCVTDSPVIVDELFHGSSGHNPHGANQTVFGLDVIPEYRRQGIAAKLMEAFIQTARKAGRKSVILTCKTHLIHYYERFGFANLGLSASTHGGAEWYDMTCRL